MQNKLNALSSAVRCRRINLIFDICFPFPISTRKLLKGCIKKIPDLAFYWIEFLKYIDMNSAKKMTWKVKDPSSKDLSCFNKLHF